MPAPSVKVLFGVRAVIGAAVGVTTVPSVAAGQLTAPQVLVVYDSGIADSLAVAEYYAGSANVPGGVGGIAGARPHVRAVDLSAIGGGGTIGAELNYSQFVSQVRDPLRAYLDATGLATEIRCLALTKGLPHRVRDTDRAGAGDNSGASADDFNNADATYCSMDSELTLLWQDLDVGEAGLGGDSKSDGVVLNPYAQQHGPIGAWSTANIRTPKSFTGVPGTALGQFWRAVFGSAGQRLSPGDIYLVCRLDGRTIADVRAVIDRAAQVVLDVDTAVFVLDESNHGGTNPEFDDDGISQTNAGDDYEQTSAELLADGRFDPANVRYNNLNNAAGFSVGPLLSFDGEGLVISGPVLLLAHEGNNHAGPKPGASAGPDPAAGDLYAESFNYADGAIFNTIESFNGRAYNGLGTSAGQEQSADFLAAGGTFAVASVYEPFTFAIPDNWFIVQNFLLGTLTWAEAAYTSLPVLSWTYIVVGDPLARPIRSSDDVNGDGRLTIDDLYAWEASPTDLNRDGNADDLDRGLLETSIRGTETGGMIGRQR